MSGVITKIQAELQNRSVDAILLINGCNRRYVTGFPSSSGAVLVTRTHAYFITDSRYIEAARHTITGFGIEVLESGEKPEREILTELLQAHSVKTLGFEEDFLTYKQYTAYREKLRGAGGQAVELFPAAAVLAEMRKIKSEKEIELMVKAQRIAEKAFDYILGFISPGVTEREIAAELTYRMTLYGGEGNSFEPIAVAGKNSSMPHGVPGDYAIRRGDFLTMDFGCVYGGYCSDMTRTVAIGGVSDEMRRVYDTVLEAQLAGISAARAGVTGEYADAAARNVIKKAGYGDYFGHSFGHSLGLEVHEEPRCGEKSKDILSAGVMMSAEPGIYLPGKFGVRIEDVIRITESGNENITKAPKELIIL